MPSSPAKRKEHYEKNKERLQKVASENYANNKSVVLDKAKNKRANDPEQLEKERERGRDYYYRNREDILKKIKDNRKPKTPEQRVKMAEYNRKYYAKNKERLDRKKREQYVLGGKIKKLAHAAVCQAVKSGILIKPIACENCDKEVELDGHHESYDPDKWLEVIWLCRRCHRLLDRHDSTLNI